MRHSRLHIATFFVALLGMHISSSAVPSYAQNTIVAPSPYANVNGNNSIGDVIRGFNSARTYQYIIGASVLNLSVGTQLTGLRFRQDQFQALPSGILNYNDYEITLAQSARSLSDILAQPLLPYSSNMIDPVLVRAGSYTVDLNDYPDDGFLGAPTNSFGPVISFNQTNYTYQGGDLVVYITHSGHDNSTVGNTFASVVDSQNTDTANPLFIGLRSDFNGGGTFRGITPFERAVSVPITGFDVIPEPATWGFLLCGGVLLGLCRRQRTT